MDNTQLDAALQTEYLHLQKCIEDFDAKALTIKAWSVTFSLVVVVGAFTSHSSIVLLVAALASVLFWFLETLWKSFQLGYYCRTQQIEDHFNGKLHQGAPHQIGNVWVERWNRTPWSEVIAMSCWPHIALPHVVVAFVGVALFLLARFGFVAV